MNLQNVLSVVSARPRSTTAGVIANRRLSHQVRLGVLAFGALLLLAWPAIATEGGSSETEVFRAYAISLGGLQVGGTNAPSGATSVDFVIDRFSTESERKRLLQALEAGGRDKLYRTMDRMDPVGRIQVRGQLGYDLRYAREVTTDDGGRAIILATNRPLRLGELTTQARSRKYDISVIELVVDGDGRGAGTAMPAVRVELDAESGDISLLDLNTFPIQLSRVEKVS